MSDGRWQFTWCDANSPPANGDSHDWKCETFAAPTLDAAMDGMLAFVRAKPFECLVDYECEALHVPYSPERHGDRFRRIDRTDHALAEYTG